MKPVYIVDYKRTPFGAFNGALSQATATELAAHCIRPMLARLPTTPDLVVMGQALPAGCGQSPTTALLLKHLQLPNNIVSYSVNKVCSSGMRAIMSASDAIQLGQHRVAVAGGAESMSSCPHLLRQVRRGCRFGGLAVEDGVEVDGLVDGSGGGVRMGVCGDRLAGECGVGRREQDELAQASFERAISSQPLDEIVPYGSLTGDEQLCKFDPDKMATLKPCFTPTGTVTAANSSPVSDGAAFVVLCGEESLESLADIAPLARIVGYADAVVDDPLRFPMAMVPAIHKALAQAGIAVAAVGCWEVSEAFAVVPAVVCRELGVDPATVNKRGGAVSIGHPLGATGARLTGSVAVQLASGGDGVRYGVAAVCNGGGGASAIVLERVPC